MTKPRRRRSQSAFTLIELIVAIGLMIILISAVALIFYRCVEVFKVAEARTIIYTNARASCDKIAQDLAGTIPITPGVAAAQQLQHFKMAAGKPTPGVVGKENWMGDFPDAADGATALGSDWMVFNTVTSFAGVVQVVRVSYFLTEDPDPEKRSAVRTNRKIFVLWRTVRSTMTGATVAMNTGTPDKIKVNGADVEAADLCHYVVQMRFDYTVPSGSGVNPGTGGYAAVEQTGYDSDSLPDNSRWLPTSIRLRMRLIEDSQERQERLITRVIWVPMGGF